MRTRMKILTCATAAVAALLTSTAAYGWVARHGAGHGSATANRPLQPVTVVGTSSVPLDIGETVTLSGTLINPNTFTVSVARVRVAVIGIGAGSGVCDITPGVNFVVTDAVPPAGHRFVADGATPYGGIGSGDWSGATITFRSTNVDQRACLGRRLVLGYNALSE